MPTIAISFGFVEEVWNLLTLKGDRSIVSTFVERLLDMNSVNSDSELGPKDRTLNCSVELLFSVSCIDERTP